MVLNGIGAENQRLVVFKYVFETPDFCFSHLWEKVAERSEVG